MEGPDILEKKACPYWALLAHSHRRRLFHSTRRCGNYPQNASRHHLGHYLVIYVE